MNINLYSYSIPRNIPEMPSAKFRTFLPEVHELGDWPPESGDIYGNWVTIGLDTSTRLDCHGGNLIVFECVENDSLQSIQWRNYRLVILVSLSSVN